MFLIGHDEKGPNCLLLHVIFCVQQCNTGRLIKTPTGRRTASGYALADLSNTEAGQRPYNFTPPIMKIVRCPGDHKFASVLQSVEILRRRFYL